MYVIVKILIENINKIASCQDYKIKIQKKNKKDKISSLYKMKLGCTKRWKFKENVRKIKKVE